MAIKIDVSQQKPLKARLLPFLPRVKLTVDLMGYQVTWRQAPILETLLGMKRLRKGIIDVARMQFDEMDQRSPKKKTKENQAN